MTMGALGMFSFAPRCMGIAIVPPLKATGCLLYLRHGARSFMSSKAHRNPHFTDGQNRQVR